MQCMFTAAYGHRGKYFVLVNTLTDVCKGLIQNMITPNLHVSVDAWMYEYFLFYYLKSMGTSNCMVISTTHRVKEL